MAISRKVWLGFGWLLIALGVLWFLYVIFGSTTFRDCVAHNEEGQSNQTTEEGSSELTRPFIVLARIRTDCFVSFMYDSRDAIAAIATIFIAIFTLALWRSTDKLWQTSKRQIDEVRRSTDLTEASLHIAADGLSVARESGDAAKQAAKASQRSVELTMDTVRAYVAMSHYSHPDGHGLTVHHDSFFASIRIRNDGQTPANVARAFLTYKLIPRDAPAPDSVYNGDNLQIFTGHFLTAGAHYNVTPRGRLTPTEYAQVQDGTLKLWLYGCVEYSDAFERHHRAGYGRVYSPSGADAPNNLVFEPSGLNYDWPAGEPEKQDHEGE